LSAGALRPRPHAVTGNDGMAGLKRHSVRPKRDNVGPVTDVPLRHAQDLSMGNARCASVRRDDRAR